MPAVRIDLAERSDIGRDDDPAGRPRELAPLRVDDRAAGAREVNGPVRLAVRERRVLRPVEDLDRPGAQDEDAEPDADEDGEPADADVEAVAPEERCVRARVRLQPAAAGEVAREPGPAPGIGGRDSYGCCGSRSGCDDRDPV